jgi:DNA-binding transcriptional ArsR family regulator
MTFSVKSLDDDVKEKAPLLDPEGFAKAMTLIRCLDNPNRLAILCLLCGAEMGVTDMAAAAGLSLSAMSQHLSVLRNAGLVTTEKRQQQVIYRLSSPEVKAVIGLLKELYCSH